jgi:hypothetical protein
MHPVTQAFKERVQAIVDHAFYEYESNPSVNHDEMIVADVTAAFDDVYARLDATAGRRQAWTRVVEAQRAFVREALPPEQESAWQALIEAEEAHAKAVEAWRRVLFGESKNEGEDG